MCFITLQSPFPGIDPVDHRQEIIAVDGNLGIESLRPAEVGVGAHLRKAEQIHPYIALRREAYGANAEAA